MSLKATPVAGGPRDLVLVVKDVTFSSSYPAGGEPLNASDFELSKILFVAAEMAHAGKLQAFFDPTAVTLRLVGSGAASGGAFTEVTAASNNSSVTARLLVAGIK